ncbi:uncharacterized protein CCOS01_08371 [Colletotrichum costaricense]|uniref:Uncharacterized protein n=1 Tax=Colletotrichum costaricense TaxID=1209916 RepID=A0AAJ0DZK3_9PEZI|nr:uncharacterized protein CCOS01_08371 [Colletotrichum costaricense]KAI3542595.1 hypothetical protein CSPX01_06800 [Colletotrichum filicis]KAK1525953.1 hypothetical protein CCOS01_08371 [Colletotrichum costaricense]
MDDGTLHVSVCAWGRSICLVCCGGVCACVVKVSHLFPKRTRHYYSTNFLFSLLAPA